MEKSQKSLKILQNSNFPKGNTAIIKRAKRLRNISDAETLISRITSEYIKGNITAEESRNLNQLILGFVGVHKDALEEGKLFEYIHLRFELLQWESIKSIDSLTNAFIEAFQIDPDKVNKIAKPYSEKFKIEMGKRNERANEILQQINDETTFKIKLTKENKPEELKKLILLALRKITEADRYKLIDEIKENFYGE
ncbi:hypothetical protein ASZ90_003451 [hydrocarbon metagenome]|uniref:Uncharacterized protein n=1 Tax=hydrocarbon metagenome TaxID=938273 RepID=A0A0W8G0S1_9ZZZZ